MIISKHQYKAKFKNLDDSEVPSSDFSDLQPLQPRWPHWPLQPRWPLQPQIPYFTKELPGPDGWIAPGTKMTNTGPFLLNESSKIQIFTDISIPLLSEAVEASQCHFFEKQEYIKKIYHLRIPKLLSNKIFLAYFHLSEPIHKVQFNVKYSVQTFIKKCLLLESFWERYKCLLNFMYFFEST